MTLRDWLAYDWLLAYDWASAIAGRTSNPRKQVAVASRIVRSFLQLAVESTAGWDSAGPYSRHIQIHR
jgi:hypothetical protein